MEFLPMPHHFTQEKGVFSLKWNTVITLENTQPSALLYAQLLRDEIRRATGLEASVIRGKSRPGDVVITPDSTLPASTHRVQVTAEGITISGGSDEALLHGCMTLAQWVRRHGAVLPLMTVEDYPELENRGYYQDCSRGRVPTLASLKATADLLVRYKINQWQLYIEHTYLFRDLTEAWREDTPLSAEDIMELDAYCRARHIELVPSLSTFGHMYQILSTKTCCELCELPDSEKEPFTYTYWGNRHTLNVSNPNTMDFIKGLITEYMSLFTSRKFNICCDETWDLGKGRSAKLAEEKGTHALYLSHVTELLNFMLEKGVTPMFWGDIILHHPETYDQIPKGVICLNWGYSGTIKEDKVRILHEMGATQYVCPGVSTWNRLLPNMDNAFANIRNMCTYAHRFGAIGLLNTDWGDYGHVCDPVMSVPGIIHGAALSWNQAEYSMEEMNEAISLLEYGDRTGKFLSAFAALCRLEGFWWGTVVHWIEEKDENARREKVKDVDVKRLARLDAAFDKALAALDKAAVNIHADHRPAVLAMHLGARGAQLTNRLGRCAYAFSFGKPLPYDGHQLACDLESWYHQLVKKWREVSREGALRRTTDIICAWADLLRGRDRH